MSEDRERRYEEYRLRGKDLLKEFEGRKASISEADRQRACEKLGLLYTPQITTIEEKRREIEEIKAELNELAIKVGLRTHPENIREALGEKKASKKREEPLIILPH